MVSLLGAVFSFEGAFALFLFAGVFKESPRLAWFPLDLTVFAFGASLASGIWRLAKRRLHIARKQLPLIMAMFLFCAWALVSLAWTSSIGYGTDKALILCVFGFWSLLGPLLITDGAPHRVQRFLGVLVLLSLWVTWEIATLLLSGEILRELEWGNQYLGMGRLVGMGVLVTMGILLWGRVRLVGLVATSLLAVIMLTALLVFGGRGPFLATILAMAVIPVADVDIRVGSLLIRKRFLVFSSLILFVLIYFFFVGNYYFYTTTLDRLWMLLEPGGEGSANTRFWFFSQAWEQWTQSPIWGGGIGSFNFQLGWRDVVVYPHNIILEILAELGLVGLALFSGVCYLGLRAVSLSGVRRNPLAAITLMLLVNAFVNSMVTGDLSGNRILYAMLGMMAGLGLRSGSITDRQSDLKGSAK